MRGPGGGGFDRSGNVAAPSRPRGSFGRRVGRTAATGGARRGYSEVKRADEDRRPLSRRKALRVSRASRGAAAAATRIVRGATATARGSLGTPRRHVGEGSVSQVADGAAASALAARAAAAEPALLEGCGFDLRIAHPHRAAADLVEALAPPGADGRAAQRDAALDGCDALLTTNAPLHHAPSVLAAAAALASADKPGAPAGRDAVAAKLGETFAPAAVAAATALAKAVSAAAADDDDAGRAELKRIRKRLKKCALWRGEEAKRAAASTPDAPPAKRRRADG